MSFEVQESAGGTPVQLVRVESVAYGLSTRNDKSLTSALRGVCLIPGSTECGYATTLLTADGASQNGRNGSGTPDLVVALDELQAQFPNLQHVSLVVAWFGTSTSAGQCQIKPMVERKTEETAPFPWRVGPVTRGSADLVPTVGGRPAYGSTPSDRSVYEAIVELKRRGLRVTLYPFILMASGGFPWRGRIVPSSVGDVAAFVGGASAQHFSWDPANLRVNYSGPNDWGYYRFILHLTEIAREAGADTMLIGSEMIGMTTYRSGGLTFPFVDALHNLVGQVAARFGREISYAADWTEYFGTYVGNDRVFHLDKVWGHQRVSFVGIDQYQPVTDWRDGVTHLDYTEDGIEATIEAGIRGGENYDWYYASEADRNSQTRTPIEGEGVWIYRSKDLWSWWENYHYDRLNGTQQPAPTPWVPRSKPIRFTEIGFPAVDKGTNQPNVFVDPKSTESAYPAYSSGVRNDQLQRAALETYIHFFRQGENNPWSDAYGGRMLDLDNTCVWSWDARPSTVFPRDVDFYGDAPNWPFSHALDGRIDTAAPPVSLGQRWRFDLTSADRTIYALGGVFEPCAIQISSIRADGMIDDADLEIKLPRGTPVVDEVLRDPSAMIHITVYEGHLDDAEKQWLAVWSGRLFNAGSTNSFEATLRGISGRQSMRRTGLRRTWQKGCQHALYGPACRADRLRATRYVAVQHVDGRTVSLPDGWWGPFDPTKFDGGVVEWLSDRVTRMSNIAEVFGTTVVLERPPQRLEVGQTVGVTLGCNHQMSDCAGLHFNIHNFGGAPYIPLSSPFGAKNSFT